MTARRQLADGRTSRGYVPMEVEAVDTPLSAEALGLLLRVRHDSSGRERDGDIDGLALQALVVYCQIAKSRLPGVLQELQAAGLVKLLADGGLRDLNFAAWSKTRAERDEERADWRERKRRGRGGVSDGQLPLPVPEMSHRDIRGNPSRVPGASRNTEAEAETEKPGATGLRPSAPVRDGGELKSAGSNGESADVAAYAGRFEEHGRTVSPADLAFLRRVPYEFDRLSRTVVLAAIDDVAERFAAQQQPMPAANYLAGRLAEVQAHAADSGIRPRSASRGSGGLARTADVLDDVLDDVVTSTGDPQAVNSEEE